MSIVKVRSQLGFCKIDPADVQVPDPGCCTLVFKTNGEVCVVDENGDSEVISPVSSIFNVQTLEKQTLQSTTAALPGVNAFCGDCLTVPDDGDYLAIFETDINMTNNNGIAFIAVELNGTTVTSSIRLIEGNDRSSAITFDLLQGLTAGDVVCPIFGRDTPPGSAQIRNRTFTLMRVG